MPFVRLGLVWARVCQVRSRLLRSIQPFSNTPYDTDRYGRTVCVISIGGVNVNESLIKAGYAWQYRKYGKEGFCEDWLQVEGKARNAKLGIWGDSERVPWQWRKGTLVSSF
jgi:micrococcal nuclease